MTLKQQFPDTITLGEVREYLKNNWEKGVKCPCCTNFVKLYSRPITSSMSYGLILIYKYYKKNFTPLQTNTFIHVENVLKEILGVPASTRGDLPKLKYWGLLLPSDEHEGYYKLTEKGIAFIKGEIKVQSHIMLFNNKFYGFKGEMVGMQECLKKKFNYNLLMGGVL